MIEATVRVEGWAGGQAIGGWEGERGSMLVRGWKQVMVWKIKPPTFYIHCSDSWNPVWKMHGTSVRNTIICMAQRTETIRASLLDTGSQDTPAQYLTQQSYNTKERKTACRGESWRERTRTNLSKQRERACVTLRLIIYVTRIRSIFTVIVIIWKI